MTTRWTSTFTDRSDCVALWEGPRTPRPPNIRQNHYTQLFKRSWKSSPRIEHRVGRQKVCSLAKLHFRKFYRKQMVNPIPKPSKKLSFQRQYWLILGWVFKKNPKQMLQQDLRWGETGRAPGSEGPEPRWARPLHRASVPLPALAGHTWGPKPISAFLWWQIH